MGNGESLVGRDPWGRGWEGGPQLHSKRKCSRRGGDESLSKGFRGRWTNTKPASTPACPQMPSPSPEPNATSEWFRVGGGPLPLPWK